MKCPKCGESLPDDSEFCQYCGTNIGESLTYEKTSYPEKISSGIEMETTNYDMPPIMPNVKVAKERHSSSINGQNKRQSSNHKMEIAHFCKKCGGEIDPHTKRCTSCGKQYFRTKAALQILTLSLFTLVFACLNIFQYISGEKAIEKISMLESSVANKDVTIANQKSNISSLDTMIIDQKTEISNLKSKVSTQETTISSQKTKVSNLERELKESRSENFDQLIKLLFYEEHAVVVPDDGTWLYHTYGCEYLDNSYFWIYNTEQASGLGYKPCKYCQN